MLKQILLVCYASPDVGIGHLSRLLALAHAFRSDGKVQVEFLIFGEFIEKSELAFFKTTFLPFSDDFAVSVKNYIQTHKNITAVVYDLYPKHDLTDLGEFLAWIKDYGLCQVSVDSLLEYCDVLDLIWIPSFYLESNNYKKCTSTVKSGWECYLIQKRLPNKVWKKGLSVLVLTGGSDITGLGNKLPVLLDEFLNEKTKINWVRGPYAARPSYPDKSRLNWIVHNAPENLDELIVESDYVMTLYGVSFFEVLQYGIPSVVFSPYGNKDNNELMALSKEGVAMVAHCYKHAVDCLIELMKDEQLANEYSVNASNKMAVNGAQSLSNEIYSLIGLK